MNPYAEFEAIAKTLGGIPVWGILPGSAAERAGIRAGDIVIRVNGIETRTLVDLARACEDVGERVDLEIFRRGHLLKLRVTRGLDALAPAAEAKI